MKLQHRYLSCLLLTLTTSLLFLHAGCSQTADTPGTASPAASEAVINPAERSHEDFATLSFGEPSEQPEMAAESRELKQAPGTPAPSGQTDEASDISLRAGLSPYEGGGLAEAYADTDDKKSARFALPLKEGEEVRTWGERESREGLRQSETSEDHPDKSLSPVQLGISIAAPTPAPAGTPPAAGNQVRSRGLALFGRDNIRTVDLLPGEELWVIARSTEKPPQTPIDSEHPGCGSLLARLPEQTTTVPVPLKHTAVSGRIDGYIASVDVTQQFHNPFASKIEAVYVFPLPENAAVNEFIMTIGDRRIRGIIREREKAEQIYNQARSQGHVASLLTQERPNIFTQQVANIEPGKQIDINIRYFNTLRYEDGAYEFVFPMVVGPRYNPAGTTDGIGAVARGSQASSPQSTDVQYMRPQERSGHDISLKLSINAGVDIVDLNSVNHQTVVKNVSECERQVELSAEDTIPNRDFVLRYRVAGDQIRSAMLNHSDQHGQYFTMMVYPPAKLSNVQRSAMEMVFVLDCSGSMNGKPIQQAKAAIAHAVRQLTPRDTFQIIQFSSNSSQLGSEPLLATEENIQRGLAYLNSLRGSGGTEMIEGIKAALDFPHDEGRFRLVSFMTDGFIGNEQQILETMSQKLGASRVFSFGVGQAPNRYLMDRMAILGRGAVSYLSLNDDAVDVADRFLQRISHPAMTDLYIDFGEMEVSDVYPRRLPDLIVGRPVIVTGRYKGIPSTVTVGGRIGLEASSFPVSLSSDPEKPSAGEHPGIAAVWARMKIADLMQAATRAPAEHAQTTQLVTQTALNYNLMSAFTSFVAVDSLSATGGEFGTTVAVPLPVPEGVRYDTTVSN